MPLLAFWKSNPKEIGNSSIEQIVMMAGDVNLRDGSSCSSEFREYLTEADSGKLVSYVDHCLSDGFQKSGFVFQDLVNELGRRLDYKVTNVVIRESPMRLVSTEFGFRPKATQLLQR
jgi:hypothetical protein